MATEPHVPVFDEEFDEYSGGMGGGGGGGDDLGALCAPMALRSTAAAT